MKILFLLLILIPFFEIIIFITFLNYVGFLYSIFEIIITFFIGLSLFSKNKKSLLGSENNNFGLFSLNKMLVEEKTFSFLMLIGSVFLIIPGYIGDVIGILLMIKPTQSFIIKRTIKSLKPQFKESDLYTESGTEIIEGEFYDLHNDKSNISKK